MLSKLIKHEFKATARLLLPLYLVLAVMTLIDRIVLGLEFQGTLKTVTGLVTLAYVLAIIAIIGVTIVFVISRFYRNLIQDEGYLMFTLPVKSHQLINSKLIVSTIWTCASVIVVLLSLLGVFATSERINSLKDFLVIQMDDLKLVFGNKSFTLLLVELGLLIILGLINNILMVYVSIAVGQLFRGHKLLGSFIAYVAINTILQIVVILFMILAGLFFNKTFIEISSLPQIIFPVSILYSIITNVLFYFITDLIFRKKLNLE